MSFSSKLKKEICQNRQFISSHKVAVALGMLMFGRSFDHEEMSIYTEHREVSKLYVKLIYELIMIKATVTSIEQILKDNGKLFYVKVDSADDRLQIMKYLAPRYRDFQLSNPENEPDIEFLHGMLCGAFLSCANISDPVKSYHLEFIIHNDMADETICELLNKLSLKYSKTVRKGARVVYIKSSESIEDLLTMLGAGISAIEIMNVKIYKDMRNKVNRITNCETANIDKTVNASFKQVQGIRLIDKRLGLDSLPESLREIARLRLHNPDMPLSELSKALSPPISRSGANYRLKQLGAIAENLKAKQS